MSSRSGFALDVPQPADGYIRSTFSVQSNIQNALIQSRDGFLWIASPASISRFDGRDFMTVDLGSGPRPGGMHALELGPDGDLWVGAAEGLVRIPSGQLAQSGILPFTRYQLGDGEGDGVICLRLSRDGNLWAGGKQGLYRFGHESFSLVAATPMVSRIEEASNGHLLLTSNRGFAEWDGTRLVEHPELAAKLAVPAGKIYHVYEDRRGVRWFCTAAGVARETGGVIERIQPYGIRNGPEAYRAYEDPHGNVWLALSTGLYRAGASGLERIDEHTPRYIYGDRQGDLWVATNGDGLLQLKDRRIRMFTKADGLPNDVTMTVLAASDGKLWVGNNCGGLSWFDGQRFHTFSEKDGLTNSCVFVLAEDADHDLWAGTYGGGVFRFHDGQFTQYSKAQGLAGDLVRGILPARDKSLWVSTDGGISILENRQIRSYSPPSKALPKSFNTMYEDRRGGIWGSSPKGVFRLNGQTVLAPDAPPSSAYHLLGEDAAGNLYASADRVGILRIEPTRLVSVAPPTLYMAGMARYMAGMARSEQDLWLCAEGLYRAAPDSLERWEREPSAPLDYTHYGPADGMSQSGCIGYIPDIAITGDGKVWMATAKGLAMIDPRRARPREERPAIYLESVIVGGKSQAAGKGVVLQPGTHHVEFHLGAIELHSPERIHFQYRLDGVDQEWIDADATATAIYTGFALGTHQFHVRACNGDGIWDRAGITYGVTQLPYFYETNIFRTAVAALFVLALAAAYRIRLRQLMFQMDVRLAERTRIARDLHDTLFQTISASNMMAKGALKQAGNPAATQEVLRALSESLGQAAKEARASVQSLRNSTSETNELTEGLRQVCEDCALNHPLAYHIDREGAARQLHPIVRDEVFLIGAEAIRNAFLHSGGANVDVLLSYVRDFSLLVRDNGSGIDPRIAASGREGHFGLAGMRERAERISGKLCVSSTAQGTDIALSVPARIAFRRRKLIGV